MEHRQRANPHRAILNAILMPLLSVGERLFYYVASILIIQPFSRLIGLTHMLY